MLQFLALIRQRKGEIQLTGLRVNLLIWSQYPPISDLLCRALVIQQSKQRGVSIRRQYDRIAEEPTVTVPVHSRDN